MPTDIGQPFSTLWRGTYPAMLKEDYPVWNRFLDINPTLFERVYYNVRVGGVYPDASIADSKMRYAYWQTTAKRIDVLAELKDELWIIEVAARPGLRALGQLQTYIALWFEDPKLKKPAKAVLVCQSVDADVERSLKFYGVLLRYAI